MTRRTYMWLAATTMLTLYTPAASGQSRVGRIACKPEQVAGKGGENCRTVVDRDDGVDRLLSCELLDLHGGFVRPTEIKTERNVPLASQRLGQIDTMQNVDAEPLRGGAKRTASIA